MKTGLVLVLAAAAMSAGEAWACSILPPVPPPQMVLIPGEPQEETDARSRLHYDGFAALQEKKARDAEMGRQAALWDGATAVAVVEVLSARDDVKLVPGGTGRGVRVKPVSWLKGGGDAKVIDIAHTGFTSCGPMPWWDAIQGQPGDRYIVFFSGEGRKQADMSGTLAARLVADSRVVSALAERVK